jgi:hypothetical protein
VSEFSLHELFARDPKEISDEEFLTLISSLREQRKKFVLGEKPASKSAASSTLPSAVTGLKFNL